MPRPFTPGQAAQNRAFLHALAETGNARLAARALKVHRSTYTKRRARCPAFAAEWDQALAAAQARLHKESRLHRESRTPRAPRTPRTPATRLRTKGGEPTLVRTRSGRLQLRLAPPGRLTKAAEQAFLSALSASANIRLSAAAAGFAHSTFYARALRSPAFAREMRLALETGYVRLEAAAIMAAAPQSHADDAWRHNDLPPIPPMTADQALHLLFLHERSVRQSWEKPHRKKRRNESEEAYVERLRAMWTAEKRREAEDRAVHAAWNPEARRASEPGPPLPPLPDLAQVTGWSKASGRPPHNPARPLFGGWRLEDWKRKPPD